ncbi:MAG: peptidoglycan recognition family protein [Myxococcota bacterium]
MQRSTLKTMWVEDAETYKPRKPDDITGVVVHRIEVSQEDVDYADTPVDIIRFFRDHPTGVEATGGKMPYPILIAADGTVTQTVPLGCITPHAKAHNADKIGVACIGDFRNQRLPAAQRRGFIRVVTDVMRLCNLEATCLHGHDELSDASEDPDKECPGHAMDLPWLRDSIAMSVEQAKCAIYDLKW